MLPFADLPMYQLLLLILLSCTSFLAMLRMKKGGTPNTHLPPSPPGLPIIGNLHQLGSLPHRSLRALSDKHGPLMHLRLGRVPTLVVSSADTAREILRTHDLVFASRPSLTVANILLNESKDITFAPYGDYWRQVRKICVTHLLSNKMVQAFSRTREEEVDAMISEIEASEMVDMSEVLFSFANDVVCGVVSGKLSVDGGRKRVLRDMFEETSAILADFHIEDYLPCLGWMDRVLFGLTARARRNRKRWDDVLDELICDSAGRLRNDMFAAGTDTSYAFLEWAMTELVRNPRIMEKLQDEVRKVAKGNSVIRDDDLRELSYLKAVLMEILRLHPPAPLLIPHESMKDCEIQGYKIPKGTRVIINFWANGRDPKSWERPEEFQPERFIDNPVDFQGTDFRFIPFGAGRRICPGMNFAVATVELALANLMHKFDWELPTGMTIEDVDMTEAPGLTTRRKQGLHLTARSCMS